jgi:hypothetical protein
MQAYLNQVVSIPPYDPPKAKTGQLVALGKVAFR